MESLTNTFEIDTLPRSITYCGLAHVEELTAQFDNQAVSLSRVDSLSDLRSHFREMEFMSLPEALVIEVKSEIELLSGFLAELRSNLMTKSLPVILLVLKGDYRTMVDTFSSQVDDIYFYPFPVPHIKARIQFLHKIRMTGDSISSFPSHLFGAKDYRISRRKRLFDIMVAGTFALFSLPIMLVVSVLIKLDSKGPILYKSKRAGSGYRVFDFYKFRSMRNDADKELERLSKEFNQYANGSDTAFVKIKDDPRVTRLGAFLRNSSLDELPQLFNVIKGDMSLVGNRPLPLYEAVQLTSDQWAARFLGPAGITGLWQVTKRGRGEMSDHERRQLDNYYAEHGCFSMDVKILLQTIPALFQKENV